MFLFIDIVQNPFHFPLDHEALDKPSPGKSALNAKPLSVSLPDCAKLQARDVLLSAMSGEQGAMQARVRHNSQEASPRPPKWKASCIH